MAYPDALRTHAADTVATALRDLSPGDVVLGVAVRDAIPRGHKLALARHSVGEPVIKFGHPIGRAIREIMPGAHVHTHNLATALGGEAQYAGSARASAMHSNGLVRTWEGYSREDGSAGTRNEIWILPTVGCVARTAQKIAARAHALKPDGIDGIYALVHPFGCSQLGADLDGTRAILAALAQHPNAAGVLLVGLGCESNQLDALIERIPREGRSRVRSVAAQAVSDELSDGVAAALELAAEAATARRTPLGLDRLVLGLKCGGSDGLSGLTANPLVGRMADAVTGAGGSAILTEIPEIFGAEQLLMARAADRAVFDAIGALVNRFKRHFLDHGEPVSENPSPGNLAGGITTLEEKSLGAVQKGGQAVVTDVVDYGGRARQRGLTLLEAPGNDAVSSTALSAAGAGVILFTTGRGTPLGFPAPTLKIASNSDLARRKPGWIDFDAGMVLDADMDIAAEALLDQIIAIASGEPTAAERNDEREIAIWKRGVTL
ncbi:altronate dehydratase family protein [Sphingomonas sp. ST-64]|uniref:Altronate dehydratase family protein n=1 Tax=Sphingomonas plantiphila TaxID=3163295 RepID=A0ABW8YKR7_9SPHN